MTPTDAMRAPEKRLPHSWLLDEQRRFQYSDGARMTMGCKHRRGSPSACGGCFARLAYALELIEDGHDAKAIIKAVYEASRAEVKR